MKSLCIERPGELFLKNRIWEIWTFGSVRGIKVLSMVEYCDTLHTERGEKQGIPNIPKGGI